MKVITDGTEQLTNLLANDTPLQLPTFRHEVMPSSQSHQVGQTSTRSNQGNDEGGPASTTTPIADETKMVMVKPLPPPPPPPPSSIPAANSTKQKKKKKNGKHKYTSLDLHPPLPCPLRPALAAQLFLFLFQTDGIVFLATRGVQLHRPEERVDCARVFLVQMRDPTLIHQSVTPPESWPLAPGTPTTLLAITQLLAEPPRPFWRAFTLLSLSSRISSLNAPQHGSTRAPFSRFTRLLPCLAL